MLAKESDPELIPPRGYHTPSSCTAKFKWGMIWSNLNSAISNQRQMAPDVLNRISEISSILGLGAIVGIITFLIICCRRMYYVYHLRDARRDARGRIGSIQDEIRSLRDGDPNIDDAISQALHTIILDRERRVRILSQIEEGPWISFCAVFRADPCLRLLVELEQDLRQKVQRMTEARQTRLIVMSANNARQKDAAFLPTTADMSSPQTNEAGVTRQPAESASPALSHGHSTIAESIDTDHGDLGVMVTNRPAPSPLPALIEEQARQSPEIRIESLQRDELEIPSHTPQEVRETHDIILSANNARQTDAALPTTADMSSPQTHEAGATRQPAISASRAFSSGHITAIEPKGADTGNLRRRAPLRSSLLPTANSGLSIPSFVFAAVAASKIDVAPQSLDCSWPRLSPIQPRLNEQADAERTAWETMNDYLEAHPEPIIGSIDNPFPFADEYGIKGLSILSAFIDILDMDTFTCRFCSEQHDSVDDALNHQRTARHFS